MISKTKHIKADPEYQKFLVKQQMISIAWKLVEILDGLTTKLWNLFEEEFKEKLADVNQRNQDIPF